MQEWGNPTKEEYYYYMKSYSPQDNVRNQRSALIILHELPVTFSESFYVSISSFSLSSVSWIIQIQARDYPNVLVTGGLHGE